MNTPDLQIGAIGWKLDNVASCSFVEPETRAAAGDAAQCLRQLTLMLGVDATCGATALSIALNSLQESVREIKKQKADAVELLNHWVQLTDVTDDAQASLCTATASFLGLLAGETLTKPAGASGAA